MKKYFIFLQILTIINYNGRAGYFNKIIFDNRKVLFSCQITFVKIQFREILDIRAI